MKAPAAILFSALSLTAFSSPDLEILDGNYPVSFFFRQTEADAAAGRMSYGEWESGYSRMNGVMGKMLDEEVIGRSAAQPYYRRFKSDHPRQAVLLHANGGFRKPIADISAYHDGHWLYYNGAKVLDDIGSSDRTITVKVSDVTLFQLHPYRSNPDYPDDVGLCALDSRGMPDWNHAEQTRLLGIDEKAGTITLERSVYGDGIRHAYRGGEAYVASHVAHTWGTTNKLWEFNMSTACPGDADGRQAADVWADELIDAIRPGGAIDFIDGYQFDVPFIQPISNGRNRSPDADADTVGDGGVVDGSPIFTLGVERFFARLKAALPDKLIMADSGGKSQRSLKYLNGMETEGFPELKDTEFHFWSTSINYHEFWATRSAEPRFHYGLMKYLRWPTPPATSDSRLIMAGTTLHGAAVPLGSIPDQPAWFVYDEILGGELDRKGWLGKPVEPVRRLALETPTVNSGKWRPENVQMSQIGGKLVFQKRSDMVKDLRFSLGGVRRDKHGDMVVTLTATAKPRDGYPEGYYRELTMEPGGNDGIPDPVRDTNYVSPVTDTPFQIVFHLRNMPTGELDLDFIVEGSEPFTILDYSIHEAADLTVREFENGLVLANPSDYPQVFDLDELYPGKGFRRLQATNGQDPSVNTGQPVRGPVTVPPLDALFLLKE